jgi:hypothetical protein
MNLNRQLIPTAMVALAIGLICGLPHLLIPTLLKNPKTYSSLNISRDVAAVTFDETVLYGAQLNYVTRTLRPPLDAGNWEHRSDPDIVPTLPYFLLAPIARLSGSSDAALQIADFVLPPLGFLAAFAVARQMGASVLISIASALVLLVPALEPRNCLASVLALLRMRPAPIVPLEITRFFAPELSLALLLCAVWLVLRARTIGAGVLAGAIGGLLFYTYLFTWVVWLPAVALVVLYRTKTAGATWKHIDRPSSSALVTGCFVGIPLAIQFIQFSHSAQSGGMTSRMQYTVGHVPDSETVIWSIAIAAMVLLGWRSAKENPVGREALLFVCGGLIAYNGQIVLGKTLESFHLPNRFFQPYLGLVLTALLLMRLPTRTSKVISIVLVVSCLGVGLSRQLQLSILGADRYELTPASRELFAALSRVASDDDVVLASDGDLNLMIPAHTRQRTFLPYYALTVARDEEQADRFAIMRKLLAYDSTSSVNLLMGGPLLDRNWAYHLIKRPELTREQAQDLIGPWNGITFPESLRRYRVNWVVVSPSDPVFTSDGPVVSAGGRLESSGAYGRLYRLQE